MKSAKTKKTTAAQFRAFKDEFAKWQKEMGLVAFDVEFELQSYSQDGDTTLATTDSDGHNFIAAIGFARTIRQDIPMNVLVARDTALHECLHLLLTRYREMAGSRFVDEDALFDEEEKLVRTIEKLIDKSIVRGKK